VLDAAALQARLADVRERIARAAGRAGRDPGAIRLVAVSKTFDTECVRAAAHFGQVDFGENKVQDALPKMDATAGLAIRWHLVGHLQSNKLRRAAERFDTIHSVDGIELGAKLDRAAAAAGRQRTLLVQVDLAGEATKHGVAEDDLAALFDAAPGWHAARLAGLMVVPPAVESPEHARPYFRALRSIRDRLAARGVAESMLTELSMGMSHDFEVAIEEGATMVRVGTAIFGSRTPA
jgi:pyridoxal phosphate enzyme (YggS family)